LENSLLAPLFRPGSENLSPPYFLWRFHERQRKQKISDVCSHAAIPGQPLVGLCQWQSRQTLATELTAVISELDGHTAAGTSGGSAARQGTVTRAEARGALREDLEAINRTARAMDDEPGLNEKFRLPRGNNDQQLLSAARAFAADALPLKARFIAHELPADFLEDLDADITALEEAMGDQSGGLGSRVAASAVIDDAIERGTVIARKLDAIIRNKYGNDRATIAEWTSASHTERRRVVNGKAGAAEK